MGKNQWLIGIIVAGVIVIIFVVFNYQGSQDTSLSDIFPEDATKVPETEYEFVTDGPVKTTPPPAQTTKTMRPVSPAATTVQAPSAPSITPTSGTYSIQILSSKDQAATQKALEKVKSKGHAAYMVTKDLGDKGVWYRINVGSFSTKQEAESYLPSIKNDYKDSFIVYTK